MKVEVKVDSQCNEPYAVIYTDELTNNIQTAINILEKERKNSIIMGERNERFFVISNELIELITTSGKDVILQTLDKKTYKVNKTLYELQSMLGNDFVRISKSSIVCIKQISHVCASFNGTMEIVMKSGIMDVITRSYKKEFKERLGV